MEPSISRSRALHRHDRPRLGLDLAEVGDQVLAARVARSARAARGRAPSRTGRPGRGGGCRPFALALPRRDRSRSRPVASRRDLTRFIKLPWRLYRNEPHWVPPLVSERRRFLDREQEPLLRARRGRSISWPGATGEPVGRISAHVDRHLNEFQEQRLGPVRLLRVPRTTPRWRGALLDTAEGWLRGARPRPDGRARWTSPPTTSAGCWSRATSGDPLILAGLAPPLLPRAARRAGASRRRWTSTCGSCGSTRSRTRAASTR